MARKKKYKISIEEEPTKKSIAEKLLPGVLRKRPKNMRDLGFTVLKNLPANIALVQHFMKAVDWRQAQAEVQVGMNNTIVIVGQPNSGKSTLFNKIMGKNISPVSPEAGTTKALVPAEFGPFTLVDTPGHLPDVTKDAMDRASVILFLIDGSRGFQAQDRGLYEAVKKLNKPTIVAVNKIDTLRGGESGDRLATETAVMLHVPGVIPISAHSGQNIAEELLPALIDASPDAALVIGHELPAFRRKAAQRIIRNATLVSLAAGLEPIPLVDIPIILGIQIRLVLRLAALYGESMNSAEATKHARELIVTTAGGAGLRYLAEQAAKAVPFGGDLIAGAIASAGTWAIGQVALEYYEGGKQVNPQRMRELYGSFYRRFRRENKVQDLRQYAVNGTDDRLMLEEPKS